MRSALLVQLPLYVLAARQLVPGAVVAGALCDYVGDRGQLRRLDDVDEGVARFQRWLKGAIEAMRDGLFLQEPSACAHCGFTLVCGPAKMIEARRDRKAADPRLKRFLRLGEAE
jgi:hypothetical protein